MFSNLIILSLNIKITLENATSRHG